MSKVLVKFLPFEARLILDSSVNRRLGQFQSSPIQTIFPSFSEQRNTLSIDVTELTNTLKEYFDESFKRDFDAQNASGGVIYAPFSHVSLSSLSRRQLQPDAESQDTNSRFLMDGVVYGNIEPELEMELIPVKRGNLRSRRAELYLMTKTYDGVAVFDRDGDRDVPTPNYLQAKQLQAQADINGDLLQKLKNSDPSTGLNTVTEISLSVNTRDSSNGSTDATSDASNKSSVDIVIIIAVIVAACSMILLGFALYIAFRRRQNSNQKGKSKEISPRSRTTDLISPTSANSRNEKPPVHVMEVKPDHDDNISEYTESVYSAPIRKAKTQAQKHWLKEQVSLVERKPAKVSSRFNPRYIISGRSNASSSDVESDQSHGASEEMEGVPSLPTPVKMAMNNFGTSQPPLSKYTEQGAWTSSQIDDDITSSLNAYVHPVESSRKKKDKANDDLSVATSTLSSYANNLGLNRKDNDDTSVASYTSYGFSLDGVGDQSTIADTSTKYGY